VSRLTNSRAAISSVEMPRLRRASARSRPICFRACAAGKGREGTLGIYLISDISDAMSIIVCYIRRKIFHLKCFSRQLCSGNRSDWRNGNESDEL
jgi:hypothetical protein